jgi:hypothetical protein
LLLSLPAIAGFAVRHHLIRNAAKSGVELNIGAMELSLFRPAILHDIQWRAVSGTGVVTRATVNRARITLSPFRALFGGSLIASLRLEGLDAATTFGKPHRDHQIPIDHRASRSFLPKTLELENANLLIAHPLGTLRFRDVALVSGENHRGAARAGHLTLRGKTWGRLFKDIQAGTSRSGSKLQINNVLIGNQLVVRRWTIDLEQIANGKLMTSVEVAAFGGEFRGELRGQSAALHASGSLSQISIERFSEFMGSSVAAGGIIRQAKFGYRTSTDGTNGSAFSLRTEIANFRWANREFDSLVAGVTLIGNRLQIPDLQLRQDHNQLSLSGEMPITDWENWWKSDFTCDLSARIEKLDELSVFFGPTFAETSGRVIVDGSIRSQNGKLRGQLIASGSKLSIRGVPVQTLDAAAKFSGEELVLTNFQLLHKRDFLRARGNLNLRGDRRYSGELHCSVSDLSGYQPLLPRRLQGVNGAVAFDWWGDGAAKAHSGAFNCEISELRFAREIAPLQITAEGTYSPANLYTRYLKIANAEAELTCHAAAEPKRVRIDGIQLKTRDGHLEGAVALPFDLHAAARTGPIFTHLNLNEPMEFQLKARRLRLGPVFSGFGIALKGMLTADVAGTGTFKQPKLAGALELSEGQFTQAWRNIGAQIKFNGEAAYVESFTADTKWKQIQARGDVLLHDTFNPSMNLAVQLDALPLRIGEHVAISSAIDCQVKGPLKNITLTGTAAAFAAQVDGSFKIDQMLTKQPLTRIDVPFENCDVDVKLLTREPITITNGAQLGLDVRIFGNANMPEATGTLSLKQSPAQLGSEEFVVLEGVIYFSPGNNDTFVLNTESGNVIFGTAASSHKIPAQFSAIDLDRLNSTGETDGGLSDSGSAGAPFAAVTLRLEKLN